MKINTRFFGEVEIKDEEIISFDNGIPGLEEYHRFVLLGVEDKNDLKCLQCIEEPSICLMLTSPWSLFPDYEIDLSDEEISELEIESPENIIVFNVITVRENEITANLLAPIIINVIKNKGKQIIFSSTKYKVRQEIPCLC